MVTEIVVDYGYSIYKLRQIAENSPIMYLIKDDVQIGFVRMGEIIKLVEDYDKIKKLQESAKEDTFQEILKPDYNDIDSKW